MARFSSGVRWPPVVRSACQSAGGHTSRIFFGMTRGYVEPGLTIESVRDHYGEIVDETGYRSVRSVHDVRPG
jgi:hypothetical protein